MEGVWRCAKREIIYLSLHCHYQNDSCIKMDSDQSHFNVSLTVRDKVTRQCPQTTTFEEKGELNRNPSAYQPNVLPLGQTGSRVSWSRCRQPYTPSELCTISCRFTTDLKQMQTASLLQWVGRFSSTGSR